MAQTWPKRGRNESYRQDDLGTRLLKNVVVERLHRITTVFAECFRIAFCITLNQRVVGSIPTRPTTKSPVSSGVFLFSPLPAVFPWGLNLPISCPFAFGGVTLPEGLCGHMGKLARALVWAEPDLLFFAA